MDFFPETGEISSKLTYTKTITSSRTPHFRWQHFGASRWLHRGLIRPAAAWFSIAWNRCTFFWFFAFASTVLGRGCRITTVPDSLGQIANRSLRLFSPFVGVKPAKTTPFLVSPVHSFRRVWVKLKLHGCWRRPVFSARCIDVDPDRYLTRIFPPSRGFARNHHLSGVEK